MGGGGLVPYLVVLLVNRVLQLAIDLIRMGVLEIDTLAMKA